MPSIRYEINNDLVEEIHKVIVHKFKVSDSEDPDIYAAAPIWEWEQSDQGKFVIEHSVDKPIWRRNISYASYSYDYIIVAELEKKKLSEFYLKWGNPNA